jgi:hypothetical protein
VTYPICVLPRNLPRPIAPRCKIFASTKVLFSISLGFLRYSKISGRCACSTQGFFTFNNKWFVAKLVGFLRLALARAESSLRERGGPPRPPSPDKARPVVPESWATTQSNARAAVVTDAAAAKLKPSAAPVTAPLPAQPVQTHPTQAAPTQVAALFDAASGYYWDAASGYFFHAATQMYFHPQTQVHKTIKFVRVAVVPQYEMYVLSRACWV